MKLRVTVGPDGLIEKIVNLQSTGHPQMDLVASKYIRKWRFESKLPDARSESGVISIKFRLK